MKKIVGILGMAAVLASAAFAADPAANFVMSEFTGNAEFGWKADFADSDNVKMGMYNNASASLKFGFVTAGDKVTTGDGVWGELKIKNDATDATAIPSAVVDTAKIHFVDGDFSAALNIAKPTIKYGGVTLATATPIQITMPTKAADDAYGTMRDDYKSLKDKVAAAEKAYNEAKDGQAKINAWNKLAEAKKNLTDKYPFDLPAAPAAGANTLGIAEIGDETGLSAGFGLELKLEDMFALNFKLMDNIYKDANGVFASAKDKKFGMAIDAELLAVKGLTAKVGATMNFDTKYTGLQAQAGYKISIDDKLYVKPAVAYNMVKKGDNKAANALTAGLMFGWGAEGVKPAIDYLQNAKGDQVFNEGLSFAVCPILGIEKQSHLLLSVGAYDQSLFSLLGLEEYGVLKTAVAYDAYFNTIADVKSSTNTITAALAYDVTFSPIYVSLHGGLQGTITNSGDTKGKFEPNYKFGVKLGSKEVIDNTDIFAGFEVEGAKKVSKAELTLGTKISF